MGEMKKLEEVAKAIAGEDLDEGDGLYDWYALVDEVADEYRAMAKAAIEALGIPTDGMRAKLYSFGVPSGDVDECWRSLIDEALKE